MNAKIECTAASIVVVLAEEFTVEKRTPPILTSLRSIRTWQRMATREAHGVAAAGSLSK
jgi:hypothetical protein